MVGWESYAKQIEKVDHKKGPKQVKQALVNEDFDSLFKDKFT